MSGVLLDTNALLWMLSDDRALGDDARRTLTSGAAIHVSSVSILELTIKTMVGKLSLPGDPMSAAAASGLHELAFTAAHAAALTHFPDLVRHDPFDRMLLAQAKVEELRLLTADQALIGLPLPWTLDARR